MILPDLGIDAQLLAIHENDFGSKIHAISWATKGQCETKTFSRDLQQGLPPAPETPVALERD